MKNKASTSIGRERGFVLPEGTYGRIAMALTSVTLGVPAVLSTYALLFPPRQPNGIPATVLKVVVESFMFWLSVFCVIGLIWAIARPRWADCFLKAAAGKTVLSLGLFGLSCLLFIMAAV